jgi:hypothetical protein
VHVGPKFTTCASVSLRGSVVIEPTKSFLLRRSGMLGPAEPPRRRGSGSTRPARLSSGFVRRVFGLKKSQVRRDVPEDPRTPKPTQSLAKESHTMMKSAEKSIRIVINCG